MYGISMLALVIITTSFQFSNQVIAQPKSSNPIRESNEKIEEFEWKGETRKRTVRTLTFGGEKMEFVRIPKGEFQMGSPESDDYAQKFELPQHLVSFSKPLWVAKFPVTKGQFAAFVASAKYITEAEKNSKGAGVDEKTGEVIRGNPKFNWKNTGWTQTDKHPVVNVSWNDVDAFCKWAGQESKKNIRLLSEAEFEYASRAGTTTLYITGDKIESLKGYANVADKSAKAISKDEEALLAPFDDGFAFSSPVGEFKPNGFGLHDMNGNVASWCLDWFGDYDKILVNRDPVQLNKQKLGFRAIRGASWFDVNFLCRSAQRSGSKENNCTCHVGFRICFVLDE